MQEIASQVEWEQNLKEHSALLVLYGGKSCGVCQAIKPQIESRFTALYPRIKLTYVDCQERGIQLCAARSIFSLPVIQLWFEGRLFSEFVRVFSIGEVTEAASRPYSMIFNTG